MALIRQCEKCGIPDRQASESTAEEAARQDAFTGWTCPVCARTDDPVESEEEPARA